MLVLLLERGKNMIVLTHEDGTRAEIRLADNNRIERARLRFDAPLSVSISRESDTAEISDEARAAHAGAGEGAVTR